MSELRQIISQGQKRIGFLMGAGAPMSIRINVSEENPAGTPLIPDVKELTSKVLSEVGKKHTEVIDSIIKELGDAANIEAILSRIRLLSNAIGKAEVYGYNSEQYQSLANEICACIGSLVSQSLPNEENPYGKLVAWVNGISRTHPVEVFTTNYDLLFEEAFERGSVPYFDGFSGARQPFFDASTISSDILPSNWARLWKMHGSLGWKLNDDRIVRTGKEGDNALIYPEQLKYDKIQKLPYTAFFERFKTFMKTPDTLLITSGFSFEDAHIASLMDEALAQNPGLSVFALQFEPMDAKPSAVKSMALRRSNMSIYAPNGAIINCTEGIWRTGDPLNKEWHEIRKSFWKVDPSTKREFFTLGCFNQLSNFLIHAKSEKFTEQNLLPVSEKMESEKQEDPIKSEEKAVA